MFVYRVCAHCSKTILADGNWLPSWKVPCAVMGIETNSLIMIIIYYIGIVIRIHVRVYVCFQYLEWRIVYMCVFKCVSESIYRESIIIIIIARADRMITDG